MALPVMHHRTDSAGRPVRCCSYNEKRNGQFRNLHATLLDEHDGVWEIRISNADVEILHRKLVNGYGQVSDYMIQHALIV